MCCFKKWKIAHPPVVVAWPHIHRDNMNLLNRNVFFDPKIMDRVLHTLQWATPPPFRDGRHDLEVEGGGAGLLSGGLNSRRTWDGLFEELLSAMKNHDQFIPSVQTA